MRKKKITNEKILKIVNAHFNIDVREDTRRRQVVDARSICYKILKDDGFSLTNIGIFFGKHHSTIIYSLKQFEHTIVYDLNLKLLYIKCRNEYYKDPNPIYFMNENELRVSLLYKLKDYEDLLSDYKKLYLSSRSKDIYDPLFEIIKERIPETKINEFKLIFNRLANGIHD